MNLIQEDFPQRDNNKPLDTSAQGFSALPRCHFLSAIRHGVCAEPQHNYKINDFVIKLHGKHLVLTGLVIQTKLLSSMSKQ